MKWNIISLEMEDGGKDIGEYVEKGLVLPIRRISLDEIAEEAAKCQFNAENYRYLPKPHIFGKEQIRSMMQEFVKPPTLAVYGSGWFHHFTYGLTAAAGNKKFCYIHVDRHTDFLPGYRLRDGAIIYSNFVEDIRRDNANDLILIGSFISDYKGFVLAPIMDSINTPEALIAIEKHLDSTYDDVYVSFDLDVLDNEVINDWQKEGKMSRKRLLEFARMIKKKKNIIGADILGFTNSNYGFKSWDAYAGMVRKSRSVYKDLIEIVTG